MTNPAAATSSLTPRAAATGPAAFFLPAAGPTCSDRAFLSHPPVATEEQRTGPVGRPADESPTSTELAAAPQSPGARHGGRDGWQTRVRGGIGCRPSVSSGDTPP